MVAVRTFTPEDMEARNEHQQHAKDGPADAVLPTVRSGDPAQEPIPAVEVKEETL